MGSNKTFDGIGGFIWIVIAFIISNPALVIGIIAFIFILIFICFLINELINLPRERQTNTGGQVNARRPSNINLLTRGISQLQNNQPMKAITSFTDYLKVPNARLGECYFYRGLAYSRINNNSMAISDFKNGQNLLKNTNKELYDSCTFMLNKLSTPESNNSVIKKINMSDVENKIENDKVINIKTCSKQDILTLIGFDDEKANLFIQRRKQKKMWYDIDSFVQEFELQPHEMVLIQDRLVFPPKPRAKTGNRKVDL